MIITAAIGHSCPKSYCWVLSSGRVGEVRLSNAEIEKASMVIYKNSSLPDLFRMRLVVVFNAWCRSGRKTETWYGITQKRKPAPILADISGFGGRSDPTVTRSYPSRICATPLRALELSKCLETRRNADAFPCGHRLCRHMSNDTKEWWNDCLSSGRVLKVSWSFVMPLLRFPSALCSVVLHQFAHSIELDI